MFLSFSCVIGTNRKTYEEKEATSMLSDEMFEVWCLQQGLSEQTKALIQRIRSSPPSRLVRGAAGNVSGRYPSKKMGCTIQFESHRGELAFIYQMEHYPAVLAFYDQPVRRVGAYRIPVGNGRS